MSQLVVFLARPRTGTNYLVSLLAQGKGILSKSELFHPNNPHGFDNEDVFDITGIDVKGYSPKEKAELIRQEAPKAISLMKKWALDSGKPVSFKLFPGHLNRDTVRDYILADRDIKKVVIDRNILATFVSSEKAKKSGNYKHVDSSDLNIQINIKTFELWFQKMNSWYSFIKDYSVVSGEDYGYLNYNDFTSGSENDNYNNILKVLVDIGVNVKLKSTQIDRKEYSKQDNSINIADSVKNWDTFIKSEAYAKLEFLNNHDSFWESVK
jgi:hypothetical protein